MRKIILTLLIAMIGIATYIIAPIEPNIAIAGIKKGVEKPQFSYTQNIKLPDFHYNTIAMVSESHTAVYNWRGFSQNPTTWFEGSVFTGTTYNEIGVIVHQKRILRFNK